VEECPPELEQVDIEAERDRKKVEWLERVRDQERAMSTQVSEITEVAEVREESKQESHASFEAIKSVIEEQPSMMESTEAVTDLEELD